MNKYLERRLASPGILVFREKHCERYFVCNTPEDFCKAAMKMLKERVSIDYWYYDEEHSEEELKAVEAAKYTGDTYKLRRLDKDKSEALDIIEKNDTEVAFMFLDRRSDYEYESMNIEHAEEY